ASSARLAAAHVRPVSRHTWWSVRPASHRRTASASRPAAPDIAAARARDPDLFRFFSLSPDNENVYNPTWRMSVQPPDWVGSIPLLKSRPLFLAPSPTASTTPAPAEVAQGPPLQPLPAAEARRAPRTTGGCVSLIWPPPPPIARSPACKCLAASLSL